MNLRCLQKHFPLLRKIEPQLDAAVHRFSVTQLINYQRCPRQYYFDRVLHLPSADQMAVWNDAEAPEPPANLTATLKGAVIHRFCETYEKKHDTQELLQQSFAHVLSLRQAELGDRIMEIDTEAAIAELSPLAENYLKSVLLFERVQRAREFALAYFFCADHTTLKWRFWANSLFACKAAGILTGAIDKLLVVSAADGFDIEIIDFKTNRMRGVSSTSNTGTAGVSPASGDISTQARGESDNPDSSAFNERRAGRLRSQYLRSIKLISLLLTLMQRLLKRR